LSILSSLPVFAQNGETRGGPAGRFDFYVLALSWSPGFCEIGAGADERSQCTKDSGLRFVVHGLWPQNEHGYPTFCEPSGRFPSRDIIEGTAGLYPDDGLARYQWRKHGTCSGEAPSGYFRAVRQASDKIRIPESFTSLNAASRAMPLEIERAFAQANPGLRPDMMSVSCRRGILQEVRICLSRDLRGFQACPEIDRDGCRAGQVSIPPVR
jgi:ribonuclease T2